MNRVQLFICRTGLDKSASCTAQKSASQQDDACANVDHGATNGLCTTENGQRPWEMMNLTNKYSGNIMGYNERDLQRHIPRPSGMDMSSRAQRVLLRIVLSYQGPEGIHRQAVCVE